MLIQFFLNYRCGERVVAFHKIFWSAFEDEVAAFVAAFRAEVDNPVGSLDDVGVVLYHEQCVPVVNQCVEGGDELADVMEMKSCGRLIEDKECRLLAAPVDKE